MSKYRNQLHYCKNLHIYNWLNNMILFYSYNQKWVDILFNKNNIIHIHLFQELLKKVIHYYRPLLYHELLNYKTWNLNLRLFSFQILYYLSILIQSQNISFLNPTCNISLLIFPRNLLLIQFVKIKSNYLDILSLLVF